MTSIDFFFPDNPDLPTVKEKLDSVGKGVIVDKLIQLRKKWLYYTAEKKKYQKKLKELDKYWENFDPSKVRLKVVIEMTILDLECDGLSKENVIYARRILWNKKRQCVLKLRKINKNILDYLYFFDEMIAVE